jgi:hypothetical protein
VLERGRVGIVAFLAILVVAVGSSASEQPTAVHHYVAFKAGRVAPGLSVIASVRGYCPSESGLMNRRYAWRFRAPLHL